MISELCISDLEGHVTVVLAHAGHIEAPNWHRDGYLIVNGGGRLFRVDLGAPELVVIDTGAATNCNNDHGISPCGTRLVVSDQAQTEASCIYTLPVAGGAPVRVTRYVPSYWHGWSPDGATLAYVGKRDAGLFGLYVIGVEGGAETCLTNAFDHVDGPDYTRDGRWIWFNGERNGVVDLWRIPAKGGAPERMTDDTAVNWFPHPSPCGEHVVYLAYPKGTKGHPAGLDVSLRVTPAAGGASRKLVELHGGQGSINVPSWAPDSRAFAFVRYVS